MINYASPAGERIHIFLVKKKIPVKTRPRGCVMGSGASVLAKQCQVSISLSPDLGQLLLFPMIVDKASPQFFVYCISGAKYYTRNLQ